MVNKVSKSDLIDYLAESTGLSKKATKTVVDRLFDKIETTLVAGDAVTIQGFGRLFTREAKGRSFKKINSDEVINVDARSLPKIKFSKKFVERVKE
jgi:DNA-binding protein HU-beta